MTGTPLSRVLTVDTSAPQLARAWLAEKVTLDPIRLAEAKPVGKMINDRAGVFTMVHCASSMEQAEGNRVLAVTSARRPGIMYPDRGGAYQCFDQTGVIGRFAKWSAAVSAPARLPELARKALRRSFEGRPGVVHLDVPETIMNGTQDALMEATRADS